MPPQSQSESSTPSQPTSRYRGRFRGRGRGASSRGRPRTTRQNNMSNGVDNLAAETQPSLSETMQPRGRNNSRPNRRRRPQGGSQPHDRAPKSPPADTLSPTSWNASSSSDTRQLLPPTPILNTTTNNSSTDLTELSAKLSGLMTREAFECTVCLERIRRTAARWSCPTCYTITHLHCARKWASRGVPDDSAAASAACPSCRATITKSSLTNVCYCGRRKSPAIEPGVVPGSCGEPCLKQRGALGSSCPHRCTTLCHPGPCLPCLVMRPPQPCFCGRNQIVRACGEPAGTASCEMVCQKMMSCGHQCRQTCHPGDCPDCTVAVTVQCFCGKSVTSLPCGVEPFSCGEICGKPLKCGSHTCEAPCHDGDCAPCKLSPSIWSTCACGKQMLTEEEVSSRNSCVDPIPSCGSTCGRELGCVGDHRCKRRCGHPGNCGECKAFIAAECRCGSTIMKVLCGVEVDKLRHVLICDRKCNDRLLCREHYCQTVCCPFKKRKAIIHDDIVRSDKIWSEKVDGGSMSNAERRRVGHQCAQVCNKALTCGKHHCDLVCGHQGDCPPCGILVREPLSCACGAVSIPAPVRCGATPPSCGKKCSNVRPCGHPCPDICHYGPCPPCVHMERFSCVGGHGESRFLHCLTGVKGFRCHRGCGRPLSCGVHACRKPCHGDYPQKCEPSKEDGCPQACGLPRKTCEHSCLCRCHPGLMCPDMPCKSLVTVTCPCRRREETAMCMKGGQSGNSEQNNVVRLHCDEECEAQARIRGFASAIGKEIMSDGTVISEKDEHGVGKAKYSDFLLRFAEGEPKILAYFEKGLAGIVQGLTNKFVLDDIPQLHRMVLHNLAEIYSLDSESTGRSSNRRLTVKHRGAGVKPRFPSPLLSEAFSAKLQDQRRSRQTHNRSLKIYVAELSNHGPNLSMENIVEKKLKGHAGFFKIVGRTKLSSGLDGVCVEFSTMERTSAAAASLRALPRVTVESDVHARFDIMPNEGPSMVSTATNWTQNSWNELNDNDSPSISNSNPNREVNTAAVVEDDNVPESWDD